MIPKRAADICYELEREDDSHTTSCKRQRLWSTEDYEATRSLGGGAFGDVVQARHRATGEAVAVKALRARTPAAGEPTKTSDEVLCEAGFLATCRGHPALDDLHAIAVNPSTGDVALVMECVGPSLHDVLYSCRYRGGRPFPESDVRCIMRQLLDGARHMHSRRIIHRDIKPGNILVGGGHDNVGVGAFSSASIKICDLGLAVSMSDPPPYARAGTRTYMAPEVLLGKCHYDSMVDMWSLGCVMAELLTGTHLFHGKNDVDQILKIFKVLGVPGPRTWPEFESLPLAGTVPVPRVRRRNRLRDHIRKDRLSEEGFHVLKRLLSCDIDRRLSAAAALRSPWFNKDGVAPALSNNFLLY